MEKIKVNLKIKILIGILVVGIVLVSAWWIWSKITKVPLEKCIEVSSFVDYYEKAGIPFEPEWMSGLIKSKSIPIRMNFSDIEIYNIPLERAGGDWFTEPIIKSDNLYCELTDKNIETLFAPIQKKEAIDYVIFRLVTLGQSGYAVERTTILDKKDYENDYENYECGKSISDFEKRITTLQETKGGFLVNWVYYTIFGTRAGYYEEKIKVGYNAKIELFEEANGFLKPFIDCGEGAIF